MSGVRPLVRIRTFRSIPPTPLVKGSGSSRGDRSILYNAQRLSDTRLNSTPHHARKIGDCLR